MKSSLAALLALTLLLSSACSSTQSSANRPAVDPYTDPTLVGAVDSAVAEAAEEAATNPVPAQTGRRIGAVAGVFAAIFGGESSEPIGKSIDRYRRFRDAGEAVGTVIGVKDAAARGWQRGYAFDLRMAELVKIEGLDVTRPFPDQIDVRFLDPEAPRLHAVACALANAEPRSILVEAPGGQAFDTREQLIDQGVRSSAIQARRNDEVGAVVLHLRMQY
jgi:hypothetical protein